MGLPEVITEAATNSLMIQVYSRSGQSDKAFGLAKAISKEGGGQLQPAAVDSLISASSSKWQSVG
jgi:hypothetical protein